MGVIDYSVKSYVKIPEIFAQLFNECFFDREHYIRTEDLIEQDSVKDSVGRERQRRRSMQNSFPLWRGFRKIP